MKKLFNLDIRGCGVFVDLKVHREVHDHDNVGQEDEHGCVRPGDEQVIQELNVFAVVVVEVLRVSHLAGLGLELLH